MWFVLNVSCDLSRMIQEWEGRMNVGMSNSVMTAIRDSIRDTSIGKIRNTEKADRATMEQVCKMFSVGLWCFLPCAEVVLMHLHNVALFHPFQPS
jgi:hypothetical protein